MINRPLQGVPGIPVSFDQAESLFMKYPDEALIDLCFMHMFEKANWLGRIAFDLIIDATIVADVISE